MSNSWPVVPMPYLADVSLEFDMLDLDNEDCPKQKQGGVGHPEKVYPQMLFHTVLWLLLARTDCKATPSSQKSHQTKATWSDDTLIG